MNALMSVSYIIVKCVLQLGLKLKKVPALTLMLPKPIN